MAQGLVQNVIDTMDSAHQQRGHLTELLGTLKEAKEQISTSASSSRETLKQHFSSVQKAVEAALQDRLDTLLANVDRMERDNLKTITEFEDTVNESVQAAAQVMEDGKQILSNDPTENLEILVKFKDNPNTKNLECIPESPCLSDVPFISAELPEGLKSKLSSLISEEGRVIERAPVQITDIIERPGSILVKWAEIDDDIEPVEFCLQYCYGNMKYNTLHKGQFHTAYTGQGMSHTVRLMRTNAEYSFRVRCRAENSDWGVWSVPKVAMTTIAHYKWNSGSNGYTTSNEDKTATREISDETSVLYSSTNSYITGCPITFFVLDAGENSPLDGIGLAVTNDDTDTLKRKNALCVSSRGNVFVDGQEMKTKLPNLVRGSRLTIETEDLANGKVRVSVEVEGKEVTFDWKIEQSQGIMGVPGFGGMMSSTSAPSLYFGMQFSHEDWRIGVE